MITSGTSLFLLVVFLSEIGVLNLIESLQEVYFRRCWRLHEFTYLFYRFGLVRKKPFLMFIDFGLQHWVYIQTHVHTCVHTYIKIRCVCAIFLVLVGLWELRFRHGSSSDVRDFCLNELVTGCFKTFKVVTEFREFSVFLSL